MCDQGDHEKSQSCGLSKKIKLAPESLYSKTLALVWQMAKGSSDKKIPQNEWKRIEDTL